MPCKCCKGDKHPQPELSSTGFQRGMTKRIQHAASNEDRDGSLGHVEDETEQSISPTENTADIRRTDIPRTVLPDVNTACSTDENTEWNRAEKVGADHASQPGHVHQEALHMGYSLHDHDEVTQHRYPSHVTPEPLHAVEHIKGRRDGRAVWKLERPGAGPSTLKTWPLGPKLVLTGLIGLAQPQRQRRGAGRLHSMHVSTPAIIAGPSWSLSGCTLEIDWVHGSTALEYLEGEPSSSDVTRAVATEVGLMIDRIASGGFVHRDMKLSNIIIEDSGDQRQAWLIDTVDVRRSFSKPWAIYRMLERLDVELRTRRDRLVDGWSPVVRAALSSLGSVQRRAVLSRLRSHPRP